MHRDQMKNLLLDEARICATALGGRHRATLEKMSGGCRMEADRRSRKEGRKSRRAVLGASEIGRSCWLGFQALPHSAFRERELG